MLARLNGTEAWWLSISSDLTAEFTLYDSEGETMGDRRILMIRETVIFWVCLQEIGLVLLGTVLDLQVWYGFGYTARRPDFIFRNPIIAGSARSWALCWSKSGACLVEGRIIASINSTKRLQYKITECLLLCLCQPAFEKKISKISGYLGLESWFVTRRML